MSLRFITIKVVKVPQGTSEESTITTITTLLMANVFCKNVEYIANGECTSGWYYSDGTDVAPDLTVAMICTGRLAFIYLTLKIRLYY